jgi:LEA14-like dessication related protein
MTMNRALFVPLILLLGSAVGCRETSDVIRELHSPTVKVESVRFADIDYQGATVLIDLSVRNPYSSDLPVAALDYTLSSDGFRLLTGRFDARSMIPAKGRGPYAARFHLSFDDVISNLPSARRGRVVPWLADLHLFVDAPGTGMTRVPVTHEGEFPLPEGPQIDLHHVMWESVAAENISAVLYLDVTNVNDFPLEIGDVQCSVSMGGRAITDVRMRSRIKLDAHETRRVPLPFTFFPVDSGIAIVRMIAGPGATYALSGRLAAHTPYGQMELPFRGEGRTTFR